MRIEEFKKRQRFWMEYLNNNPDILYINDAAKRYPDSSIYDLKKSQFKQLKRIGFSVDYSTFEYTGNDPAAALDSFLKVKPIFLECLGAIALSGILAMRDVLTKEEFNNVIKIMMGGKLIIGKKAMLPSFYNVKNFNRSLDEKIMSTQPIYLDPNDFKMGNIVYLCGPNEGFNIHPASNENGYNLLWLEQDGFLGFSSKQEPLRSQAEIFNLFEQNYQQNLSFQDLKLIKRYASQTPNEQTTHAQLNRAQIFQLVKNNNRSIDFEKLIESNFNDVNTNYAISNVSLPACLKNRNSVGAICVYEINPVLFELYLNCEFNNHCFLFHQQQSEIIDKPLPISELQEAPSVGVETRIYKALQQRGNSNSSLGLNSEETAVIQKMSPVLEQIRTLRK
jgi:hypothetical protein